MSQVTRQGFADTGVPHWDWIIVVLLVSIYRSVQIVRRFEGSDGETVPRATEQNVILRGVTAAIAD